MYKNQSGGEMLNLFKTIQLEKELDTGLITILQCRSSKDVKIHGFTFGTQSEGENNIRLLPRIRG